MDDASRPGVRQHAATARRVAWLLLLAVLTLWTGLIFGPPGNFLGMLRALHLWEALALAGFVWWVVRIIRHRSPRLGFGLTSLVVSALVSVLLVVTGAAGTIRFRAEEWAMSRDARAVIAHPTSAKRVRRIGWYRATDVEVTPSGMRFIVPEAGFIDQVGFAYSTRKLPRYAGTADEYEHLHGGWYIWTRRFN